MQYALECRDFSFQGERTLRRYAGQLVVDLHPADGPATGSGPSLKKQAGQVRRRAGAVGEAVVDPARPRVGGSSEFTLLDNPYRPNTRPMPEFVDRRSPFRDPNG